MTDQLPAAILFGIPVYAYSIFLCFSIAAGIALMALCQKKRGMPRDTALRYSLWAIPMCVLGARLFYCLVRWDFVFYEQGWAFIFSLWKGGFALYGALLGGLLAAMAFSRAASVKAGDVLDCAAPGAALVIAGARFSEALTTQGIGRLVEAEGLQHFPFAVPSMYGDFVMPVFFYEGITALVICAITYSRIRSINEKPGDAALLFLLLFGASQVIFESLREDDFLRWGFVRVSQMMSMGLVLAVAVLFGVRAMAGKTSKLHAAAGFIMLALGVGLCVLIEFALDKSPVPNVYLYTAMAIIMSLMTGIALVFKRAGREKKQNASGDLAGI